MLKKMIFFLSVVIFFQALSAGQKSSEKYPWLDDLEKARQLAFKQNKPLLVVFRCVP